jgi:hypothetical protein
MQGFWHLPPYLLFCTLWHKDQLSSTLLPPDWRTLGICTLRCGRTWNCSYFHIISVTVHSNCCGTSHTS